MWKTFFISMKTFMLNGLKPVKNSVENPVEKNARLWKTFRPKKFSTDFRVFHRQF